MAACYVRYLAVMSAPPDGQGRAAHGTANGRRLADAERAEEHHVVDVIGEEWERLAPLVHH